jgi:hypothetical protein
MQLEGLKTVYFAYVRTFCTMNTPSEEIDSVLYDLHEKQLLCSIDTN